MKKSLLTLALAACCLAATAQITPASPAAAPAPAAPAGYQELMSQTISTIMHAEDAAELRALAAKMERAATVAPADWLPQYYQAYALVISVFQSPGADGDAQDKVLDQAEAALAQARQRRGDESELLTLQAYLYQARLAVSPMLRSLKYSRLATEAVAQAKALNPTNPRPYLVGANNVYFTPSMFGGGAAAAKPLYEEAKTKYAACRPASPLAPSWGQGQVLGRLKRCEAALAAK